MKGQGNILKTLLIAAVVYTLALGAPVKRDTSSSTVTNNTVISNTVTEACAAATDIKNIKNCSDTDILEKTPHTYSEDYAAEALSEKQVFRVKKLVGRRGAPELELLAVVIVLFAPILHESLTNSNFAMLFINITVFKDVCKRVSFVG